jgi:hypothetical protein
VVETFFRGDLKKLKRHPEFDSLMISAVEMGLSMNSWEGLIYIMHWIMEERLFPLYVEKLSVKA